MFNKSVIGQLWQHHASGITAPVNSIDRGQYQQWTREYVWQALRNGKSFGRAFCEQFGVLDNHLLWERDHRRCENIIETTWLMKSQPTG